MSDLGPYSDFSFHDIDSIFSEPPYRGTHEVSKRIEAVLSVFGPSALRFLGSVLGWKLGRVSTGGSEAKFLGHSDEVSQGFRFHLLHDLTAMNLDCLFTCP
jgi:hypothetical protein